MLAEVHNVSWKVSNVFVEADNVLHKVDNASTEVDNIPNKKRLSHWRVVLH